jgi:hypothetical protein
MSTYNKPIHAYKQMKKYVTNLTYQGLSSTSFNLHNNRTILDYIKNVKKSITLTVVPYTYVLFFLQPLPLNFKKWD